MNSNSEIAKPRNAKLSRRDFVHGAAAASAAFTILPRYVLGGAGHVPPNDKLNVAVIGTGGQAGTI